MDTMMYFRFFQDLWRFFREHSQPVSAEEWWSRSLDQADQLAKRYGESRFAIRTISAVLEEIERIYREKSRRMDNE